MDIFEVFIASLDYTLSTRKRRHIVGGMLLSVSLLFGGLAVTAMTISMEDKDEQQD